jgi:hypothetical protein
METHTMQLGVHINNLLYELYNILYLWIVYPGDMHNLYNWDMVLWIPGAYAPLIWNAFSTYLKMSKEFKQKCCVHIYMS